MSAFPATIVCERVRAQISLELDGELSMLERRMLASHVGRCPECSAYVANVRWFTERLREAPLETLERPVVVPRTRRLAAVRYQVGVAAAVAVAALGLGSQLASRPSQGSSGSTEMKQLQTRVDLEREMAMIELLNDRTPTSSPVFVL